MDGFYSDEHGFYLVRDMVALCASKPVQWVPMRELLHNMSTTCWSNGLTPWKVVLSTLVADNNDGASEASDNDEDYQKHKQRIADADLAFPLIVSADGWYNVMDGMHRLCRARQLNCQSLPCVLLSRQELRTIRLNKDELMARYRVT